MMCELFMHGLLIGAGAFAVYLVVDILKLKERK